jgi:hypothetical protein
MLEMRSFDDSWMFKTLLLPDVLQHGPDCQPGDGLGKRLQNLRKWDQTKTLQLK